MLVVFDSWFCCKLFIMCFLRSVLIAFQRQKLINIFLCWARAALTKKIFLLLQHTSSTGEYYRSQQLLFLLQAQARVFKLLKIIS